MVGVSGSGKSSLATALAVALDVPRVELDALFWLPGWVERPGDEFTALVSEAVAADRWVVDGNYSRVAQPLVWARADTVVWLDLPRRTVMRQIVLRTLRRVITRTELWDAAGNRERWQNFFSRDPQKSIIAWAWTRYPLTRQRYAAAMTDPARAQLNFIRVTSRAAARRLVAQAAASTGRPAP